jgi:penicillin-binding protein 2
VTRVESAAGQTIQEFPPRLRRELSVSADTLQRVRSALYDAVHHPKGTSYAARVPGLDVAGKTGTAQLKKNHRGEAADGDENNDHAWFASFAPYHEPKIAVVVLIEHGGFGAKAATPTAMEIYQHYFNGGDASASRAPTTASAAGAGEPKRQGRRSP